MANDEAKKSDPLGDMHIVGDTGALFAALAKAQAQYKTPRLDGRNDFRKTRYATLASLCAATVTALSANGLAVTQLVCPDGSVVSVLGHESGAYLSSRMLLTPEPVHQKDKQGTWMKAADGSYLMEPDNSPSSWTAVIKWSRRVSYAAITGVTVPSEDEAAQPSRAGESGPGRATRQPPRSAPAPAESAAPARPSGTPIIDQKTARGLVERADALFRDAGIAAEQRNKILAAARLGTKELQTVDGATIYWEAIETEARKADFDVAAWRKQWDNGLGVKPEPAPAEEGQE